MAYLGYNFFYACGSPSEPSTDKPAICESIDTLKLDIWFASQTVYYKLTVDQWVAPIARRVDTMYQTYYVPSQTKLVNHYLYHGKPLVDDVYLQIMHIYKDDILPAATPYLNSAKDNLSFVKGKYHIAKAKIAPYYDQITAEVGQAQSFIKHQYDQLPPPLIQAIAEAQEAIFYWINRVESTDLVPVLIKYYHILLEYYYDHVFPLTEQAAKHAKQQYNTHLKQYVDEHVKPLLIAYNERAHLDQLFDRARALLNQKDLPHYTSRGETVASTIVEIKTPTTTGTIAKTVVTPPHKETHINIVDKAKESAASASDKIKEGVLAGGFKQAADKIKEATVSNILVERARDAASAATNTDVKAEQTAAASNIFDKVEDRVAESINMIKGAASETYVPMAVKEEEIPTMASATIENAEPTIGLSSNNKDEDIVRKPAAVSITPSVTPEFEDLLVPPPDANKKEAIYCPTCNAQEEQLIAAPTEKHMAPISEEQKEVFEIHQVLDTPPQSPNNADYLKKDIQAIANEKELFEVHKEPIIASSQSHTLEDAEEKEEVNTMDQKTVVLDAVVAKQHVKIPITTTDTSQDNVVTHGEDKDSFSGQEAFVVKEKEEPSIAAEQPTVVVVDDKEPVVPDDQSEFVVAKKEAIAVGGIPIEQAEEVSKKVEP